MEQYDNRGLPYADNDTNFKQNLIRTSKTAELGLLEDFRHKEMTDSFITPEEADYCISQLESTQSFIEITHSILERRVEYLIRLNKERKKSGKKLISIEKEFEKYKRRILQPTVQRLMSRVKNICQIAKSRDGIGVKTLTTNQVVHLSREETKNFDEDKPKPLLGNLFKKQTEKNDFSGNTKWRNY